MRSRPLLLALLVSLPLLNVVHGADLTPTRIVVRAVSHDAKIIGSGVGGALITIRDVEQDVILARGVQLGGTGDTDRIIRTPHQRGESIYDTQGAAYFETTLLLDEPTVVEVMAEGPLAYPQAIQSASKTLLLVPGKHVEGDGIVLMIHGFILRILEPQGREVLAGEPVDLEVRMNMT